MTDDKYKYDVILGNSVADAQIAKQIAEGLRAAKLRVWFSESTSQQSTGRFSFVNDALEQSRVLILLISANSTGDQWIQLEKQTLKFRDPVNRDRHFIPVRVDDSPLPASLHHMECLDWNVLQPESVLARLAAVCQPPPQKTTARGKEAPRKNPKRRVKIDSSSRVRTIAFDTIRRRAIYGSTDGSIFSIDLDNHTTDKIAFVGHHRTITSLDLHHSKPLLLSCSDDGAFRLWNVQNGKCLRNFPESTGIASNAQFAGDAIVSCAQDGDDGVVHLWDEHNSVVPRELRGHHGIVYSVKVAGEIVVSAGSDRTIRVWNFRTGQCQRVLEGHTDSILCLAPNKSGTMLLSGSQDRIVRLWDLRSGLCLNTYDAHTSAIRTITWHSDEDVFASSGWDRNMRLWNIETGKLLCIFDGNEDNVCGAKFDDSCLIAGDPDFIYEWRLQAELIQLHTNAAKLNSIEVAAQVQYTNAKVLLVGDSGAGKTGLSKRLAGGQWEASAASTVGAWATQWSIPTITDDQGDREIWLWDFGGQADQRLIHQLYMDETSLAVLVFDAQKPQIFESLKQWDQELTRSTEKPFAKILVAGRIDASAVRVSSQDISDYQNEHGFVDYLETSALTGAGCDSLRDSIIRNIDWSSIPWRSSPVLFKRLKEEIVKIKDEGRVLMRFNELRDALKIRLPAHEINFADTELKAVLSLLSGPGVVLELDFGAWVLFQPELINAYSQAVIATMRRDLSELGCVSEKKVLSGDLVYGGFQRISPDEERFILLEMHSKLLKRGLCAREFTDEDAFLVFPSYYKRNRPALVGHPAVLVSYRFDGVVDEVYSTLIVRLNHTQEFKREHLWQDAAEFLTKGDQKIGVKLIRQIPGSAAALEIYCDPHTLIGEKIIFVKYVHDHLSRRAARVTRRRHYVCSACTHPIADLEAVERRRSMGHTDIGCPSCDHRVVLIDDLEALYESPESQKKVRQMESIANEELDNESKERVLVGDVISCVALARQLAREKTVSDKGIDMEIEFKYDDGKASGELIFLQLKSGDSYLRTLSNGTEIFAIKDQRHAEYWAAQIAPVMLVIRHSSGQIRWMEIRNYLRKHKKEGVYPKQIIFDGEVMDTASIMTLRDSLFANRIYSRN